MPFDIPQLTRFAGQLGLAIAGAAALWGFVFHLNGTRSSGDTHKAFFLLERLMLPQFLIGLLIFLASWFLGSTFFFPPEVAAHEGIRIIPSPAEITAGYHAAVPLVAALTIVTLLSSSVMKFSGSRVRPASFRQDVPGTVSLGQRHHGAHALRGRVWRQAGFFRSA